MLSYPEIDPVAVSLGPVKIHWYGLMYVIGIGAVWFLARRRTRQAGFPWTVPQIEDLIFYVALGLVVGGRLGYALFYDLAVLKNDPWMIFRVWEGGMAFHGGLLGAIAGMWIFAYRNGNPLFQVTDFIAPYVPIGLFCGRIGNFINGELWGKPTDLPWAMVFPGAGPEPRHPSQLYEAFLEGLVLFIALQGFRRLTPPRMAVSGMFLLLYGLFRFSVEFVRLPDAHIGYLALGWITMGQVLTFPMILFGICLIGLAYQRRAVSMA